jgi:hypothetical protein
VGGLGSFTTYFSTRASDRRKVKQEEKMQARKDEREDKLREQESLYTAAMEFVEVSTDILVTTIDIKAAGLLVAKMDRLSRSVVDGAGLMERAAREGWALHFADLDIDTSTPAGEMVANIIISGSQYERRLISQRTRDALAAKRARGERLGAAPNLPLEVTRRILAERASGRTFQAIADGLIADGIPTARGKKLWFPATIKALITSDNAAVLA